MAATLERPTSLPRNVTPMKRTHPTTSTNAKSRRCQLFSSMPRVAQIKAYIGVSTNAARPPPIWKSSKLQCGGIRNDNAYKTTPALRTSFGPINDCLCLGASTLVEMVDTFFHLRYRPESLRPASQPFPLTLSGNGMK
ncbi:hypothetical protein SBV1_1770019 [Verrucomicrobia bacterium]|nr:hypothetical protein SBV1_1770019 [Verrucomicrobiota bacterium]